MSGLITIFSMSLLLGFGSFSVGMLPLFFTFSRTRLGHLSTLGTGLLLGAALGVIIPEGIETLASASPSSDIPAPKIALSLLIGFVFMLLVEQLISGSPHSHSSPNSYTQPISLRSTNSGAGREPSSSQFSTDDEFAVGLDGLESERGVDHTVDIDLDLKQEEKDALGRSKAYPLTLGLVVHSLADGLALGASALPRNSADPQSSQLSFVVFLALIIHKAPTALALTMSLVSTSLPRSECKKHLAFFSMSTPLGALMSFGVLSFLGAGAEGDWPGIALLISGGTFLYVATVLQPVSHHGNSSGDLGEKLRIALIIIGMFTPFFVGAIIGHGHEHGQTHGNS